MLSLTEPVEGGSLEDLRNLLHLGADEDEERNWRLIAAWLVQALSPDGAYGILTLTGAQGSAKSDTQYVLRSLVDPNVAMIRYKPKEERDLFISASNGWTISLDNMSKVPE
jgi:putative DNA primase/helicase